MLVNSHAHPPTPGTRCRAAQWCCSVYPPLGFSQLYSDFQSENTYYTMIVVDSPQRLSVKSSLKRSLERDSLNTNSDKLTKRPKYCGTIYEAMLAPISPVTTLPIHTVYKNSVKCEPEIQNDFLDLVALGKRAKLEKFLEENIDSININQYNKDGLTPLQTVAQEGGETSADIGELLVRYGADTRLTSRDGWSAVHMATFSGNTRLMMFLLTCRP